MIRRAIYHATSPSHILWALAWAVGLGLVTHTFTSLYVAVYFVASLAGFFVYSLITDWRERNKPDAS